MRILKTIGTLLLFCHIGVGQIGVENKEIYSKKDSVQDVKHQQRIQPETLFKGQSSFGGYFAFTFGYTEVDGNAALQGGGRMMFIANHYLGIGFGGKGFINNPEEISYNGTIPNTKLYKSTTGAYGGLYLEPVLFSMKPIHLSFPILLGAGAMGESTWSNNYDAQESSTNMSSVFFVAEPGVELEFNIAKWFRIGLGASYRMTSNVKGLTEIAEEPQNSFNYGMTFKMGIF